MSQRIGDDPSEKKKTNQVVDFIETRARRLEEKRRKTERIFFKQIMGIYCVVGDHELFPIDIVDMSEEGCSFQIEFNPYSSPWPEETKEIPLRLYFTQDTYLPLHLQIQNSRHYIENGKRYIRFGCKVDQSVSSYSAYQQFVRFLTFYSEHAHQDNGKVTHFYL